MKQTTLQVPLSHHLRDRAKKAADKQGFSSVQEMVRVFLNQLIEDDLRLGFVANSIPLTRKNEKRYAKMLSEKDEIVSSRAKTAKDLMKELEA